MTHKIAGTAKLGKNIEIGSDVTIEDNVLLGNNISLGNKVIIRKGAVIGHNAIVGYMDVKLGQDTPVEPAFTEIGESVRIRSGSVIYWGTRIGANSMVGHNTVIRENTIIGHDTYVGSLTSIEGDTRIGNHVGIQTQCYVTKFCDIGDYTFIAPCFVSTNDQAMSHKRDGHGKNLIGFTTEKYVRIGANAIVLPGIRFGEGCVVSAGSVVTKDVPPYKVVMGVPARAVKDAPRDEIMH